MSRGQETFRRAPPCPVPGTPRQPLPAPPLGWVLPQGGPPPPDGYISTDDVPPKGDAAPPPPRSVDEHRGFRFMPAAPLLQEGGDEPCSLPYTLLQVLPRPPPRSRLPR